MAEFDAGLSATAKELRKELGEYAAEEKLAGSGYGLSYFEQLRTEWSLIPNAEQAIGPSGKERLQEILKKQGSELTWSDLYAFERLLTRAVPFERLKRIANVIRGEYKDLVGPEDYQEYQNGQPPPADRSNEAELRADIEQLQCEVQWLYTIQPFEEDSRNRLTRWLAGIMCALTVVLVVWVVATSWVISSVYNNGGVQPIAFVVFAGALGAVFSAQRRIQTTVSRRSSLINIMRSPSTKISVQIAPIIGALSAVVLAFLFASGLLSGALFPEVAVTGNGKGLPLCAALAYGHSDVTMDFAKLMVWSFIAGFAERLIPDALDRLAAQAEKQNLPGATG